MNERQSQLLVAIIDQFIQTALPVGSKRLIESGEFPLSSATIRNEMGLLEDEGFLVQPHVSAGRVPTAQGYRVYVKEFMKPTLHERRARQRFETLKEQYLRRKDQERVYEAVALLAQMVPNVAFATVPHKQRVYYMGLANALRQPEFQSNPVLASGVVEVLEDRLAGLLQSVDIDNHVRYYIGDDHLLPQIQSCSLVVRKYNITSHRGAGDAPQLQQGAIGVLGPMRMDYGYNTVALELVADLLS